MKIAVLVTFVMMAWLSVKVTSIDVLHNNQNAEGHEAVNIQPQHSKPHAISSQSDREKLSSQFDRDAFNPNLHSQHEKEYRRRRSNVEPQVNFDAKLAAKVDEKRYYSTFRSDLGKRYDDALDFKHGYPVDEEEKRASAFRGDLGRKRASVLGKRKVNAAFRSDLGKRVFSQFRSDLGKRSDLRGGEYLLSGGEQEFNENDDVVMF